LRNLQLSIIVLTYRSNLADFQSEGNKMTNYKIIKDLGETASGREYVIWNVIDADATDGYVYETFDLKRDAKYWIEQALNNK
jgi:hypothetical protein